MANYAIRFLAVWILLFASAQEGAAMDLIVCKVENNQGGVPAEFVRRLCEAAADATDARQIAASEMTTIIQSPPASQHLTRLHLVEAAFPSTREIAFKYSFGTAAEWRHHREKHFDDLHIDIMDAELNQATIGMFAATIRRLSH